MFIFPLIVSSPSGGGKTTVVNAVLSEFKGVSRVITATTRAPRTGEKDGADYLFWTEKQFESAIKNGQMLEWAKVFNTYYGVPKKSVDSLLKKKIIPILVIDVQGARTVKKLYKNAVSVFIMPPSMAELKRRLLARKDNTQGVALRLKTAKAEIKEVKNFDYTIINDKLEDAINDLTAIITAEKLRNTR